MRSIVNLRRAEGKLLLRAAGVEMPLHVSPTRIKRRLFRRGVRGKELEGLVSFRQFDPLLKDIDAHIKTQFISELIAEKRHYRDTTLYRDFQQGRFRSERILTSDGLRSILLASDGEIREYAKKIIRQARHIRDYGVLDVEDPRVKALAGPAYFPDCNIGIAICTDGELALYDSGRHRFVIARVLGIKRIPVDVCMISGHRLLSFMRRMDALSPPRTLRALKEVVETAIRWPLSSSALSAHLDPNPASSNKAPLNTD